MIQLVGQSKVRLAIQLAAAGTSVKVLCRTQSEADAVSKEINEAVRLAQEVTRTRSTFEFKLNSGGRIFLVPVSNEEQGYDQAQETSAQERSTDTSR